MARQGLTPPDLAEYRDDWHMSPGVASNGLLFLTGMTGHRPEGPSAHAETQIRDAFAKVGSVLREAGLDTSDIIEMTSFHVHMHDHIEAFRRIRDEFIDEPFPAWTAIEVTGLITPGTVVEIKAIAETSSAG